MTKIGLKRQQEMVRKWSIAKLSTKLSVLYMFTIFCAYIKTVLWCVFFLSSVLSWIAWPTSACNTLKTCSPPPFSLALFLGEGKGLKTE